MTGIEIAETSIGKYRADLERRKLAAVDAIRRGSFAEAREALSDAASFAAIIEEYEFLLEAMEVNDD